MSALLTLLPIYLLGNLHCLGMCGPLVASMGQQEGRSLYFLGRMVSFSIAGLIVGTFGTVVGTLFHVWHLSAYLSLVMGVGFMLFACL